MVRYIVIIFFLGISVVYLTSNVLINPIYIKEEKAVNPRFELIRELYKSKDTLNIHLHYKNIENHFQKPYFQNLSTGLAYRDDASFESYYHNYYCQNDNNNIADIGYLALTILESRIKRYEFAQKHLTKIRNTSIPYYQQEKANIDYWYGDFQQAELGFRKALKQTPNSSFAKEGFVKLLYARKNFNELNLYLSDSTINYYPDYILSDTYFYSANIIKYYGMKFSSYQGTLVEFIAALIVTLVWGSYLLKINVFKPIPFIQYTGVFTLSCFIAELCYLPYDFYSIYLNFNINQTFWNDLFYCIFAIGFIEESTKLIPIIIVFYIFRTKISEPYHFLLLASFSALGFAFMENIMYFKEYPGQIIYIRAMVSVVVHLFCTTIIIYGAKVISYGQKKINYKYLLLFFLISISIHGMFDLFLINKDLDILFLLSYILMFIALYSLHRMYNYALNISPYFQEFITLNDLKLQRIIIGSFSGIFLFEFVLTAFYNGYNYSSDLMIESLMGFLFLLTYLSTNLSNFTLIRGFRTSIRKFIPPFKYSFLQNRNASFSTLIKNKPISDRQSLNILHRISVENDPTYILAKTDSPISGYTNLLIQPFGIFEKKNILCYHAKLIGITNEGSILDIDKKSLKSIGNIEIYLQENEKNKVKSLWDKLNLVTTILLILIIIFTFVYYMNYKSARQAYKWTFPFLEVKDFDTAGNNLLYAKQKDNSYSEAHLLYSEIYFAMGEYATCLKHLKNVQPDTRMQQFTVNYLTAKSNFELKNYSEAENYFNVLYKDYPLHDSIVFFKSKLLIKINNHKDALSLLENTFKNSFDDSITVDWINCSINSEKYKEAQVLLYNNLIPKGSNLPLYYYLEGRIFLGLEDTSNACISFDKSQKLSYNPSQLISNQLCYKNKYSVNLSLDSLNTE